MNTTLKHSRLNGKDPIFGELLKDLPVRPPEVVMQPERIGAMWPTSLSFAQQLLDRMIAQKWQIRVAENRLSADGTGEVIYTVDTHREPIHFVVFSQKLAPEERTDRVIADGWDAAAALCEGELTAERLAQLRRNVPKQEYGRADPQTLVWTRGNRSGRFFDYVVKCLVEGKQPDPAVLSEGGYIFRSTAYYGNTKFGLKSYAAYDAGHPLFGSFIPQMLAAFLFRQYAADLAEHIAQAQSEAAVALAPEIRRYLGIGNATGMGLVPFVINQPQLTHVWALAREIPLARAKQVVLSADAPKVAQMEQLLHHCLTYFRSDRLVVKPPFSKQSDLAEQLQLLQDRLMGWIDAGESSPIWDELCQLAAAELSIEAQELWHTLLIQLYPEYKQDVEPLFHAPFAIDLDPSMAISDLCQLLEANYDWVLAWDMETATADALFWYFSADSEEPLIGERGKDDGEWSARPLDIPQQVYALYQDLRGIAETESVGYFLLCYPLPIILPATPQQKNDTNCSPLFCRLRRP